MVGPWRTLETAQSPAHPTRARDTPNKGSFGMCPKEPGFDSWMVIQWASRMAILSILLELLYGWQSVSSFLHPFLCFVTTVTTSFCCWKVQRETIQAETAKAALLRSQRSISWNSKKCRKCLKFQSFTTIRTSNSDSTTSWQTCYRGWISFLALWNLLRFGFFQHLCLHS